MPTERRNITALGRKRRREFDRSLQKLRDLGMPDWAAEYYRRAARIVGLPPHMLVCHVAVVVAGRQLQANLGREAAVDDASASEAPAGTLSQAAPTYESVQALRRHVTGLWREIQRHGEPDESTEEKAAGTERGVKGFAPATVTALRTKSSARHATGERSRRR